jgi:hypothetical protein
MKSPSIGPPVLTRQALDPLASGVIPSAADVLRAAGRDMTDGLLFEFLKASRGKMFCRPCLKAMTELRAGEVRAATTRLRAIEGFRMDAGPCSNCGQQETIFSYSQPDAP